MVPGTEGDATTNTPDSQAPPQSRARFTVDVYGDNLTPDHLSAIHREFNGLLQARLATSGISAQITGIWNTGIISIRNEVGNPVPPPPSGYTTPAPIYFIDWENRYYAFPIPPEGYASWVNELFTPLVFPWCDSWAEVENKAIRILAGPMLVPRY